MSKSLLLVCAVLSALFLLACSKSDSTTNREMTPTANRAPAASPAPTTNPGATSAEKIGVPECDAFIAAYEACVNDKVPAAARTTFNNSLAQWRKSWHQLAANPQTKATLAGVCKTSLEQAKQSMKAYGCTW